MRVFTVVLALLATGLPAPGLGADCDDRAAALELRLGHLEAVREKPAGLGPALDQVAAWLVSCKAHPQAATLTYRAGRLGHRYDEFQRALFLLDAVATGWPDSEEALFAAHMVLDIHNLRRDYDALAEAVGRYLATEELGRDKPQQRGDLQRIAEQVAYKQAGQMAEQAPEASARRYHQFVNRYPKSAHADEALFNAAVLFEKAGRRETAHRCHRRLVAEYPISSLAHRSLWTLSQTHLLLAEVDRAKASLERLARGSGPHAVDAQLNLIALHQALGQRPAALAAGRRFLTRHPRRAEEEDIRSLVERLEARPAAVTPPATKAPLPFSSLTEPPADLAGARASLLNGPQEQPRHLALATGLLVAGQPGPARLVASQGLLLGPDAGLATILGLTNRALGDRPAAQRAFRSAVEAAPGTPQGRINLAMIAVERGDRDLAREQLQAAARLSPGNGAIRRALDALSD